MVWLIFVIISIVFSALSLLLSKVVIIERKCDPVSFSILFQFSVGILLGIAAVISGSQLPNLLLFVPNILLMIALYTFGNIFKFSSLKSTEASKFAIISQTNVIFTVLVAVTFLGEKLDIREVLGIVLILGAVFFETYRKDLKLKLSRGTIYAILFAIFFGVAFANDAYLLRSFDVLAYTSIAFLLPAVFTAVVYPRDLINVRYLFTKDNLWRIILITSISALAAISLNQAYKVGRNLSIIAPINHTTAIVAVLLAAIFLGEKDNLYRKITVAVVSIIGIFLLL